MEDVNKLINNLYINDDCVVLACSYGPDSMCLLDILIKNKINVVVAHVNHKLRKESDKEYIDLEKHCKNNHIIFEGISIENYPKGNVENAAREFRYRYFEDMVNKYHAKYLFTAHHGDDLIETILMRLTRGSSFKGYGGFEKITHKNNYDIVRPLIYLTKDEIIKYDQDNNVPYAIDETNLENVHTRNKYRNNILPVLKEINPKVNDKFLKFSETILEYNDYVSEEVDKLYSILYINDQIDLNEYNIIPLLLKKRILNKILLSIYQDDINLINDDHIDAILKLIDNERANSYICLPKNIKVIKYYNILEFSLGKQWEDYDYIFDKELNVDNWKIINIKETDIIKSNYLIRLNSKEIKMPLHIRNRRQGDKISLKKTGIKKIKDIYINSKIKMDNRQGYPLLTDDNDNILWIPGVKKSKFDKQINEEYDIILKYIKKGEDL